MTVKAILDEKGRDVETISATETLGNAANLLADRKIGAVVVVSEAGKIQGILSERDIVRAVARRKGDCLGDAVSTVMTAKVKTCTEANTVNDVMEIMTAGRFRHLPVAENGKLIGIISIGDVVKKRIEDVVREADEIRNYIAAG
ncbi:inosine-5-monophosphate dehydrogenase [Zhengella mangrovi]|uniref:Inosine-5-monophosphate dehydrogenase n=1 Tax=Zhengella mangrovi TaxID=1982044 RepID=A0A2G1QRK8_9HYPH|nr:CBS domain-containing protein [Zhengella mangrovi]PHP68090.1 inosine-5-monophosphate dehydrogenase [Zhengella mangrovi]